MTGLSKKARRRRPTRSGRAVIAFVRYDLPLLGHPRRGWLPAPPGVKATWTVQDTVKPWHLGVGAGALAVAAIAIPEALGTVAGWLAVTTAAASVVQFVEGQRNQRAQLAAEVARTHLLGALAACPRAAVGHATVEQCAVERVVGAEHVHRYFAQKLIEHFGSELPISNHRPTDPLRLH